MSLCVVCGVSLPENSRSDRRTCSPRCRMALSRQLKERTEMREAAAIMDEAVTARYRNDWGEMVPDRLGQWMHVKDQGIKTWRLDPPLPRSDSGEDG